MERDPRANRAPQPPPGSVTPAPLAPTSGLAPRRSRRRQRGLNPWYFVLIGGLPLLILALMLVPVAGGWPPPNHSTLGTPTPVWSAYSAFFGKDQFDTLKLDPSNYVPAPDLGPGWYLVNTGITNGSRFDLDNVNVRAFFYDEAGAPIGSGLVDSGVLKKGDHKPLVIRTQLSNGPAPKLGTPNPAPPDAGVIKSHKVLINSILIAATPGPSGPKTNVPTVIPIGTAAPR